MSILRPFTVLLAITALSCASGEDPANDGPNGPPDTKAPAWPASSTLRATSVGRTHAMLEWTPATDDVAVDHYRLTRDGKTVAKPTGTTYMVTFLHPGETYALGVQAVDAAGNAALEGLQTEVTTKALGKLTSVKALLHRLSK